MAKVGGVFKAVPLHAVSHLELDCFSEQEEYEPMESDDVTTSSGESDSRSIASRVSCGDAQCDSMPCMYAC